MERQHNVLGAIRDSNTVHWRSVRVGVLRPYDRIKIWICDTSIIHTIYVSSVTLYIGSVSQFFTLIWTGFSSTMSMWFDWSSVTNLRHSPAHTLSFTDPWSSIVQLLPFLTSVNHLTSAVHHSVSLYPVHTSLLSQIPRTCLIHQFPVSLSLTTHLNYTIQKFICAHTNSMPRQCLDL
jgi:hypothetical protein